MATKSTQVSSLSEYFSFGISCPYGDNGYYQPECLMSTCKNCNLKPMFNINDFIIPEIVTFHQFLNSEYSYMSKSGVLKTGKCVIKEKVTETLEELRYNLDKQGQSYLHHRYEIKNDHYLWPQILENTQLGYVFQMDYSENISCTPKFEPQDAHFSGKQVSLHCTVVHSPDVLKSQYAYHLSDIKRHDSAFTEKFI